MVARSELRQAAPKVTLSQVAADANASVSAPSVHSSDCALCAALCHAVAIPSCVPTLSGPTPPGNAAIHLPAAIQSQPFSVADKPPRH